MSIPYLCLWEHVAWQLSAIRHVEEEQPRTHLDSPLARACAYVQNLARVPDGREEVTALE